MLTDFLHFNRQCPLCGEPLGLYMQWIGSLCFRALPSNPRTPNIYDFHPILGSDKDLSTDDCFENNMLLADHGDYLATEFDSNKMRNEAKKYQMYFFFLCNPLGIKKKHAGKHEISLYKGCYYRSSPFMEFKKDDNDNWSLQFLNSESLLINKQESFAVKHYLNDTEKVYMLSLNHDKQETAFWYYSVTDSQKKETNFKPKLFEKKMPLLKKRPNFENQEKLVERFDSWIIMS